VLPKKFTPKKMKKPEKWQFEAVPSRFLLGAASNCHLSVFLTFLRGKIFWKLNLHFLAYYKVQSTFLV